MENITYITLIILLVIMLFIFICSNKTKENEDIEIENNENLSNIYIYTKNNYKNIEFIFKNDVKRNNKKTAIIYAYHESDKYALHNLLFFLKNGLIDSDNIKYYIIINGNTILNLINIKNVNFIFRENKNSDFGSWDYFFENIKESMNFDYYMFLNSSVVGPIIPLYLNNIINWIDIFTLHINDEIKIVGCSTNYEKQKHIQSYCFCVDKIGLNILLDKKIFKINSDKQIDFIDKGEIQLLKYINDDGYKGISFEILQNKLNYYYNLTQKDTYKYYTGINTQIFEMIFLKPRLLDEKYIEFLSNFYDY